MSSQGPEPSGGDVDRAGRLIAIYWVEAAVAITMVSMRMYARSLTRHYGWDDWMMLITLFFQVCLAAFVTKYALIGGTKHLYYLTPADMYGVLKWSYIFQCWGIFAFTPAKLAVALLIKRLMHPFRGWRFWVLVISMGMLVLINSLDCIFTFVQCNPPRALWDKSITNAKCWDPNVQANISIAQASYNVFCDVLLAVIPATMLWKLQLAIRKKIGLCILLGLGLFAAVAGSIKTSLLASLSARSDLTWEMYNVIIWSGTEGFVILFCGCVPTLKPIWDKLFAEKGFLSSLHFSRITVPTTNDDVALINSHKESYIKKESEFSLSSVPATHTKDDPYGPIP